MKSARRSLLRYTLAAIALPIIGRLAAAADTPRWPMKIAAGPAPEALAEFVHQTGLQVLFEFDAIRGHTTQRISGQLDASEALALMLAESGLVFEFVNERTVIVRPRGGVRPPVVEAPRVKATPVRSN
jgi:hypothetical protein